jgi:hypothetical protein
MKRFILLVVIGSFLMFTACSDKDAEAYAQRLIGVLDSYQEQTNRKIKAEQDSYAELAQIYEESAKINIENNLEMERVERIDKLVDELIESDRPPTGSNLRERLRDYASHDFDVTRKGLQSQADARALFLADIEGLEFDAQNIDALKQALKTMAKPKGQYQKLKDYAAFAKAANDRLDEMFCQDLAVQAKALQLQIDSLTGLNVKGERDLLTRHLAEVKARQGIKSCK